ncbi:MAG: hypothetical protein JKY37_16590 [Nannocystaceae bacterium]|nr:hypothetical protein [Nannocystaceae bacterium]
MLDAHLRSTLAAVAVFVLPGCAGDDSDDGQGGGSTGATGADASTGSDSSGPSGATLTEADSSTGGDNDTGPGPIPTSTESGSTGQPMASCDTISEFVPGASVCRDEEARCTLTVPANTSCEDSCAAMGQQCLRAYAESASCVPAVYEDAVGCDVAADTTSFCQCGDPSAAYPEALVVTIGDSTMDNTGVAGESCWGNELAPFAVRTEDIHNQGSSGASSLDFETRSNWPMAEALLGPDVYLLIQFGHNDGSDDPNRHTEPGEPPDYEGTYQERLLFYVDAARAAGATPVILTSLGRMTFNRDGTTSQGSLDGYVMSAREFAEQEGLMLFDANAASRGEYEKLGEKQTVALYSFDERTHFTPEGAQRMAELTVRLGCVESEAFCAQFLPL